MKKCNLIFLPYAGGSSFFYSKWKDKLNPNYIFKPIELAGRGTRFHDLLIEDFDCLLDDIYPKFKNIVTDGNDYAVFGHSMGVILAYYLVKKAEHENLPMPVNLFLSGQNPIHLIKKEYYHRLEKKEFLSYLIELGGISGEVLNSNEILEIFLPVLKADMEGLLGRNEIHGSRIIKDAKINIFYSNEDPSIKFNSMNEWNEYSNSPVEYYVFHGGHFYINDSYNEIIEILNKNYL
ncbi:thioesterase [Listeria monocytogenes]|nr:thioesterase [Listeria monocytogenes]